jgi:hypothetical protein
MRRDTAALPRFTFRGSKEGLSYAPLATVSLSRRLPARRFDRASRPGWEDRFDAFSECEAIVAEIAADLNVEPVVLASRADLRSVRIDAADGAVTVLCDGAKGTMSLSKTAHLVTASR